VLCSAAFVSPLLFGQTEPKGKTKAAEQSTAALAWCQVGLDRLFTLLKAVTLIGMDLPAPVVANGGPHAC
jgi:hypothetical protein